MNVRVKLFAVAKELAGRDELEVGLSAGATVGELQAQLAVEYPTLTRILPHALWAVDAKYAAADTQLEESSSVALIPPVSGG